MYECPFCKAYENSLVCLNYDCDSKLQMSLCPCQGIFLHGKESCDFEGLCPCQGIFLHGKEWGVPMPVVAERMGCTPIVVLQAYSRLKSAKQLKEVKTL